MYSNNTLKRVKQVGLTLSLILGFIIITGTSVNAQWRNDRWRDRDDRRYDRQYRYDSISVAREHGFRDGLKDGRNASQDRNRYNPHGTGDYKKGTNGYEGRYGSKDAYRSAYRDAYVQGYRRGYGDNRRGRYDRNYSGWRDY